MTKLNIPAERARRRGELRVQVDRITMGTTMVMSAILLIVCVAAATTRPDTWHYTTERPEPYHPVLVKTDGGWHKAYMDEQGEWRHIEHPELVLSVTQWMEVR